MMATDPASTSFAQRFELLTPKGTVVLHCADRDNDEWWVELYDAEKVLRHRGPFLVEQIPDLHLLVRDAHRLAGKMDLDPDFQHLASRRFNDGPIDGRYATRDVHLIWIFQALAEALKSETPVGEELLATLGEAALPFLMKAGPTFRSASSMLRKRGKPAAPRWAALAEPVQRQMETLAALLMPALRQHMLTHADGTVATEQYLRETCEGAINDFAEVVIGFVLFLVDPATESVPDADDQSWLRKRSWYREDFARRVIQDVAEQVHSAARPFGDDLLQIVRLDAHDERSIRSVLRQAFTVLYGPETAAEKLRTFRLKPAG